VSKLKLQDTSSLLGQRVVEIADTWQTFKIHFSVNHLVKEGELLVESLKFGAVTMKRRYAPAEKSSLWECLIDMSTANGSSRGVWKNDDEVIEYSYHIKSRHGVQRERIRNRVFHLENPNSY
jgi:hypothetical protein